MLGIYFSGTGNTKHCLELFVNQVAPSAGCSARLLQSYGAKIIGGLHLKMPDCIGDTKALKKSLEQNKQLVKSVEEKSKMQHRNSKVIPLLRRESVFSIIWQDFSDKDYGFITRQGSIQMSLKLTQINALAVGFI